MTGGADQNVRVFMRIDPRATSAGTQSTEALIARGICHLVVDRLPDRALPELLEALKVMFEFYGAPGQQAVALPPPRRVLSAKIAGRQERPPLSFIEE